MFVLLFSAHARDAHDRSQSSAFGVKPEKRNALACELAHKAMAVVIA
jgi:hypothetical protein